VRNLAGDEGMKEGGEEEGKQGWPEAGEENGAEEEGERDQGVISVAPTGHDVAGNETGREDRNAGAVVDPR
jgi:hypothetical protein